MELGDVFLILDDRKARQLALQLNLKVIGTVGMLLRAKGKGIITEIKPLLAALNQVFAFQSHLSRMLYECWGTLIPGVLDYVKQPNTGSQLQT